MTSLEKIQSTSGTLCWQCEWAAGKAGKCPWANNFEPVPGWEANPKKLLIASASQTPTGKPKYCSSYDVKSCPLFEEATEVKMQKLYFKRLEEERASVKTETDSDKIMNVLEQLWIEEHMSCQEIAETTNIPMWKVYKVIKKIKEKHKNGK